MKSEVCRSAFSANNTNNANNANYANHANHANHANYANHANSANNANSCIKSHFYIRCYKIIISASGSCFRLSKIYSHFLKNIYILVIVNQNTITYGLLKSIPTF